MGVGWRRFSGNSNPLGQSPLVVVVSVGVAGGCPSHKTFGYDVAEAVPFDKTHADEMSPRQRRYETRRLRNAALPGGLVEDDAACDARI